MEKIEALNYSSGPPSKGTRGVDVEGFLCYLVVLLSSSIWVTHDCSERFSRTVSKEGA
jgi:hypothetical protein